MRVTKKLVFERFQNQHIKKYGNLDEFEEKEFFIKANQSANLINAKNRPSVNTFFKSKDYRNSQRRARREYNNILTQKYSESQEKDFQIIADEIPIFGSSIPKIRKQNINYAAKKITAIDNDLNEGVTKEIIYILKTPDATKYFPNDRMGLISAYKKFVQQFYLDSSIICLVTISKSEDKKNIFMLINLESTEK